MMVGLLLRSVRVFEQFLLDMRATQQAPAPHATAQGQGEWEQRIEQQLARIENEVAAIRTMLSQHTSTNTP